MKTDRKRLYKSLISLIKVEDKRIYLPEYK
jgi:hypothetical protein